MTEKPAHASKFDHWDRWVLVALTVAILAGAIVFFWFVRSQNLVDYPHGRTEAQLATDGQYNYFAYALEYRERRLTLALTYRTFLSTLGFLVGVVLSSYGGLFILRNATMLFQVSVSDDSTGEVKKAAAPGMVTAKASLITNSPGVVFLLGGVVVIFFTQYLSIQVGAPEVFPDTSLIKCDAKSAEAGTCSIDGSGLSDLNGRIVYLRDIYCARPEIAQDKACQEIKSQFGDLGGVGDK